MSQPHRPEEIAQALADPLRLALVHRLLEGEAAVAELVEVLGQPQSKVSNHLAILRHCALVVADRRGRQAIYRLRDPVVAQLVEALVSVAGQDVSCARPTPALANARTCYDHLAGRLGVELLDALVAHDAITPTDVPNGDLGLGPTGTTVFGELGVELASATKSRRRFAYACLDWTERRFHLGGALGACLCEGFMRQGWVTRRPGTRALRVTGRGRQHISRILG